MKYYLLFIILFQIQCAPKPPDSKLSNISIPLAGNTFFSNFAEKGIELTENGIENWTDASVKATIYVRFLKKGNYRFSLRAKATEKSTLSINIGKAVKQLKISPSDWKELEIGTFSILDTGYTAIILQGIEGNFFPNTKDLIIESQPENLQFVHEDFYWGRRGPSVHLNYEMPKGNQEWFYNEITVPKGWDNIGSYFMANGFAEGYFGFQVNSATERHILFSVWSPMETDDPKSIPDSLKIKLLRKGESVHIGEFGDEGSGGQSYLDFPWKADVTYKFLTQIHPNGDNTSTFTSYFYDATKWRLIASFQRPKTNSFYTKPHSFLENFEPEHGAENRKGFYSNQWVCNTEGVWTEITKATFTYDATAKKKSRFDYAGGVENNRFFLRNCGFFANFTPYKAVFERKALGIKPIVDLKKM
jgi:hypothetical protein